jgi:hypothetical protein
VVMSAIAATFTFRQAADASAQVASTS